MGLSILHERGLAIPVVLCDFCGLRIGRAAEGNYQWLDGAGQEAAEVFFTHKRCCHAFELSRTPPPGLFWAAISLQCLPVYLATNLEINWDRARAAARLMANLG